MTVELKLLIAAGATVELASVWQKPVHEATVKYEITSGRLFMFLAQVGHESDSFRQTVENLNYGLTGLRRTFPKYFPTDELASYYERQPEKIANHVYANRMGNGNEESGDGWKYRGRGLIQLTGKKNITQFSMAYFGNDKLLLEPELLKEPELASMSAAWFWFNRGLNALADEEKFTEITIRINGGLNGLDDRIARWELIKKVAGTT